MTDQQAIELERESTTAAGLDRSEVPAFNPERSVPPFASRVSTAGPATSQAAAQWYPLRPRISREWMRQAHDTAVAKRRDDLRAVAGLLWIVLAIAAATLVVPVCPDDADHSRAAECRP